MALNSTDQSFWAAFVPFITCVSCSGGQLRRTAAPATPWIWGMGAVGAQVNCIPLKGVQNQGGQSESILLDDCWSRAEYTFCSVSACSCVDVVFNPGCVTLGLIPLQTLVGAYCVIQDKRANFPLC